MLGEPAALIRPQRPQLALEAMTTQMPVRFAPSDDDPWLNAVLVTASRARQADSIEQLLIQA